MKKFMPIIISIIVTAVVSSGATYAILNVSDDKGETNAQVKVEVENEEPEAAVEVYELDGAPQMFESDYYTESKITSERLNVEIKSARLTQNYEEKPTVIITYAYTNASSSAESLILQCDCQVYQNGVALESTRYIGDFYELRGNDYADVKPGSTAEIEIAYFLNDMSSDLEVEASGGTYAFKRTFTLEQ